MLGTDVLREETAAAHTALERSDLILPATRERERFARLVGAMLAFVSAVEREIARHGAALADFGIDVDAFAKRDLLRRDADELASPAIAEPAFSLDSYAHAAGALYVLEGATLGGTGIAHEIRRHLGFEPAYYGCYGRDTAARWRETRDRLNAVAAVPGALPPMIAAATATFETLRTHLLGSDENAERRTDRTAVRGHGEIDRIGGTGD